MNYFWTIGCFSKFSPVIPVYNWVIGSGDVNKTKGKSFFGLYILINSDWNDHKKNWKLKKKISRFFIKKKRRKKNLFCIYPPTWWVLLMHNKGDVTFQFKELKLYIRLNWKLMQFPEQPKNYSRDYPRCTVLQNRNVTTLNRLRYFS